jgi:hypothetical protein
LKQDVSPAVMAVIIVIVVVIVGFIGWKVFLAKPAVKDVAPAQNQSQEMMQRMRQNERQAKPGPG